MRQSTFLLFLIVDIYNGTITYLLVSYIAILKPLIRSTFGILLILTCDSINYSYSLSARVTL